MGPGGFSPDPFSRYLEVAYLLELQAPLLSHDWSVQVATWTSCRMLFLSTLMPRLAGAMLSFGPPGPALNIQGQGVTVVMSSFPFSLTHQTRSSLSVVSMVPGGVPDKGM